MIVSTRNINAILEKAKRMKGPTTKDIDVSPPRLTDEDKARIKEVNEKKRKTILTTHNMEDVGDAAEKKRRDKIAIQARKTRKEGAEALAKEIAKNVKALRGASEVYGQAATAGWKLKEEADGAFDLLETGREEAIARVKNEGKKLVQAAAGQKKKATAARLARERRAKKKTATAKVTRKK